MTNFDNFDELQIIVIEVLSGFCRVLAQQERNKGASLIDLQIPDIKIRPPALELEVTFSILTNGEKKSELHGKLEAHRGVDGFWRHGRIQGNLYDESGCLPFRLSTVEEKGFGMKIVVSKDDGMTYYGGPEIGKFVI